MKSSVPGWRPAHRARLIAEWLNAGRRCRRFRSRRLGQPSGQVPGTMHQPHCLEAIALDTVEDELFLERTFYPIRAEAAKLRAAKMSSPPEIGPVRKLSERGVQGGLESPSDLDPCLVHIPGELDFEVSHEKRASLNREAHGCCFSPTMRLPTALISSAEYGTNGPSIAFRSSASNAGLS